MSGLRFHLAVPFVTLFALAAGAQEQACREHAVDRVTDGFHFSASSAEGAVGDVVSVDISLTVDSLPGYLTSMAVIGCYDDGVAELLEPPEYTEYFYRLARNSFFLPMGEPPAPVRSDGGKGFILHTHVRAEEVKNVFTGARTVPLMTLYFRLRGEPGDSFEVSFCDDEFQYLVSPGECLYNHLYCLSARNGDILARSTLHRAGTIDVVEGEATQPDPPDLPALAKVYAEEPTRETAEIRFELSGGVFQVGEADATAELHVSSNYDFSGFSTSILFPTAYLDLVQVDEHTRSGVVVVDNENGQLGMYMDHSRLRLGAENERVHIATLHFKIRDLAREIDEIKLRFRDRGSFVNWLAIHHLEGTTSLLPIVSEVAPLVVTDATLRIRGEPTTPGDINRDNRLDLMDAVLILGDLFRGEPQIACPDAADFNADGMVNLTDAIAILRFLFQDGPPAPPRDIVCSRQAE